MRIDKSWEERGWELTGQGNRREKNQVETGNGGRIHAVEYLTPPFPVLIGSIRGSEVQTHCSRVSYCLDHTTGLYSNSVDFVKSSKFHANEQENTVMTDTREYARN